MSKVPTWGYNADGSKLFELAPGEALPPGFVDSPVKVETVVVEPVEEPDASDELAMLKAKAAELGLALKGKHTVERLRKAIAAVEDDGDHDE